MKEIRNLIKELQAMSEEYILLTLSIDSRGRVTIPAPIRTRLGLGEGDLVEVAIRPLHKKEEVIK